MKLTGLLSAALAAVPACFLPGCGVLPDNHADTAEAAPTEVPTEAETKPVRTDYVLHLPENVRIDYQEDYTPEAYHHHIYPQDVLKIGDDWLITDIRGYVFLRRKEGNRYRCFCDNVDGSWEEYNESWLHEHFPFVWDVYKDDFYRWDETVDAFGMTLVLYKTVPYRARDLAYAPGETERYAWVNEEMGMLFELGYVGGDYPILLVTDWDTGVTEFPVEVPER